MAQIGDVEIFVETESPSYAVEAMSHPAEEGIALTDHVLQLPIGFSLTGLILNPGAAEKRNRMKEAMNRGELQLYLGRNAAYSMLITSLKSDHDYKVANGFRFTMELMEARIVDVAQEVPPETDPTFTATAQVSNMGTQQLLQTTDEVEATIKAGDTFWGLSRQFKTTVDAIQKLNPGVDPRKLQIGQKVRVA